MLPVAIVGVLIVVLAGTSVSEPVDRARVARVDQKPGPCIAAEPSEHDQARTQLDKPSRSPPIRGPMGLRVLVIGDSIACSLLTGLEVAGSSQGAQVDNAAVLGCGVVSDTVGASPHARPAVRREVPRRSRVRPAARHPSAPRRT